MLMNCQQKKDDPEILKKIIIAYFDGIKTQDLDKLNSLTTSDFVLFEDGKIWTNDSLVTIKDTFKSFKGEWKLENMKVNIDESSGNIVYFNHGDFIFNDTIKMKFDWLESATFKKVDGEWKLSFLHSTVRK
jgi:ketosteroid isomerase-like protein